MKMRVLKAYSDAGATGGQNSSFIMDRKVERIVQKPESRPSNSGDSVNISEEALQMMRGEKPSPTLYSQDATYDQYGNMTRQFESLQNDLRSLASAFMHEGESMAMAGKINSLRSQLASIKAQV